MTRSLYVSCSFTACWPERYRLDFDGLAAAMFEGEVWLRVQLCDREMLLVDVRDWNLDIHQTCDKCITTGSLRFVLGSFSPRRQSSCEEERFCVRKTYPSTVSSTLTNYI